MSIVTACAVHSAHRPLLTGVTQDAAGRPWVLGNSPALFAVGYADLPTEPRTVTAVILEYSAPESTLAPDGRA